MRIRGLFFFRRYHIPTFIIVLLLFGLVLMSLRVKQRQGVAFSAQSEALLMLSFHLIIINLPVDLKRRLVDTVLIKQKLVYNLDRT